MRAIAVAGLALLVAMLAAVLPLDHQAASSTEAHGVITINPAETHQSIKGWEVTARVWEVNKVMDRYDPSWEEHRDEIFRRLVNELGINRLRIEIRSGAENPTDYWRQFEERKIGYREFRRHYYQKINDNEDPNLSNSAGFQFSALDYQVEKILLPLARLVAANGEKLFVNLTYVDFGQTPEQGTLSHARRPDEYAELIHATFDHLKRRYGITPDALNIVLEPENTDHWRGKEIGAAIVATARRLRQAGYSPEFIAPSTTHAQAAPRYFDELISVPGAEEIISELSYHRYDAPPTAALSEIARRAKKFDLKTAMLEHVAGNAVALHADLTFANASAWQQYAIATKRSSWQADKGGYYYILESPLVGKPTLRMAERTRGLAHYFRFIRAGAVRIGAASNSHEHFATAFRNVNGTHVVVVQTRTPGSLSVVGLPAGTYGVQYTTQSETARELPSVRIANGESLAARIPAQGFVTVYQKVH